MGRGLHRSTEWRGWQRIVSLFTCTNEGTHYQVCKSYIHRPHEAIRFKNISFEAVLEEISSIYRGSCLGEKMVYSWHNLFKKCRYWLKGTPRRRRSVEAASTDNFEKSETLICPFDEEIVCTNECSTTYNHFYNPIWLSWYVQSRPKMDTEYIHIASETAMSCCML